MPPISRGFGGRPRREVDPSRVPPGQYVVDDFPVLSAGPTPRTSLDEWSLTIDGAVDASRTWTLGPAPRAAAETFTTDIHCVTKWTKLGTTWTGVSLDTLLAEVETEAEYLTAWCDGDYTTNLDDRGHHRRQGVDRLRLRRRAARPGARRPGPAARAAPVPVEEREVDPRDLGSRPTTSRASGRPPATTTTATRGGSSGTGTTDRRPRAGRLARRARARDRRRDRRRP